MQFTKLLSVFVLLCATISCSQKSKKTVAPKIIPIPLKQELAKGQFMLSSNTELHYAETFKVSAQFLKSYIANSSQIKLKDSNGENTILFIRDTLLSNKEEYNIDITPKNIKITAATNNGAFYAVQTLRQLLPLSFENGTEKEDRIAIQCLKIEDKPQFVYRGMHLDVGRHFFSTKFIKQYIDALAMLKMNTFHWHLTEDQGWRIEIKKYPKLNKIAAYRDETLIGHYNDEPQEFDGKKYGGYYSQEEIKDIVKYAQERHITIIPEIEMPGHSQAAIAAYPHLGCSGKQVEVATKWGVFEDIYCSKDDTFNFIEDVLDEVVELFPSQYIHIGGDEAPKTRWKTCSDCQHRMQTEGLKDEHELQSYFISRVESYLNSKGRQIIGWDEILEGGLAPNATVMSWRGTDGAVAAAKQKHNVINTPTSHCYFDYYQSTNKDEPTAIGGFLPLEKVYSFNPIPEELTTEESQYILGAQGNVWTEYMPTEAQVEYMVFPRILAMSEVVWSKNENKDYNDFISRVENFNKRLDTLGINYANHLYEVEGELFTKNEKQNYALKTLTKGKDIRYTLDGNEPTLNSKKYKGPIPIFESKTIKAAVFNQKKKLGLTFIETINYHKAIGKKITLNVAPNKTYSGSGKEGMINGINGSNERFGDKEWLGFWGDDLEITIDFGEITKINAIETRFYNANGQWLYSPKKINIDFSQDCNVKGKLPSIEVKNRDSIISTFNTTFKNLSASKVILRIPNYGIIPEGFQGAGNKAWTFIDEIIVK
ncbi:family 20 glycosylhydrolase [uncultured Lacinutrix sp.]|uniref:beta-N-acetylhexosaminidase n=1 Tax=uncultured Lacinutrix sp. TaxID=574032 RepID=UPI002629B980|nr:family 20 glycosylhydrolase [uncultured Lacinutrix sp.]